MEKKEQHGTEKKTTRAHFGSKQQAKLEKGLAEEEPGNNVKKRSKDKLKEYIESVEMEKRKDEISKG